MSKRRMPFIVSIPPDLEITTPHPRSRRFLNKVTFENKIQAYLSRENPRRGSTLIPLFGKFAKPKSHSKLFFKENHPKFSTPHKYQIIKKNKNSFFFYNQKKNTD